MEVLQPRFSLEELKALRDGLVDNTPDICQGETIREIPNVDGSRRMVAACAVGYALWRGRNLTGQREVMAEFRKLIRQADIDGDYIPFFAWFDTATWETVRWGLLNEVQREIHRRA